MSAVLLDARTGKPILHEDSLCDIKKLQSVYHPKWERMLDELLDSGEILFAGGKDYWDSRPPYASAIYPTMTLATTSKMLLPSNPNELIQPTEWFPGKKYLLRVFAKFTTAATPGNLTVELRLATADAAGTILATSSAIALTASKTDISYEVWAFLTCFSTGNGGASGSVIANAKLLQNQLGLLLPAANIPLLIPETANAAVTVDLQAATAFSLQVKRSGSTAETTAVTDHLFAAVN